MSLDVSLIIKNASVKKEGSGIFIRENGATIEITEAEWNERNPNRQPVTMRSDTIFNDEVYSANITHNLGKMADEAGIYEALWRPEEIGVTKASELIGKLGLGLDVLKSDPEHFKVFNPPNKWGNYEGLVQFVEKYLNACVEYPDAEILVSR